jgi:transposase InsO family protein
VKVKEVEVVLASFLLDLIQRERKLQPRIGGKKLYYILKDEIHLLYPDFGRDKFLQFLSEHDLTIKKKKSYTKTTNSFHRFRKYNNLVKFIQITGKNQVWAADITYIRTEKKFVYLSLLTDMYSRKIVGWELSESLSIDGSIKTLKKAFRDNDYPKDVIHHSDRGVQYCSTEYVKLLGKHKADISMTEENHCYENALAERVNGILKDEYLLDGTFKDYKSVLKVCKEAVELYNTRRPHWALKFKTPQQIHEVA